MKKPLLFLASILLWQIGMTIIGLGAVFYVAYAHPDGLSYGKFLLREVIFSLPDAVLFGVWYMLFGAVIMISPYRKVTGALMFLEGLYYITRPLFVPDFSFSIYLCLLINGWMIIMGLIGFFGKSYDESYALTVASAL